MAYVITRKQEPNVLYKIISTDDIQYHVHETFNDTNYYSKINITEEEYNNYKNNSKVVGNITENSVTWVDTPAKTHFNTLESFQDLIKYNTEVWEKWLENNKDVENGYKTRVQNYVNYLKNTDFSNLTFPMTQSLESYLSSINQEFVLINEVA